MKKELNGMQKHEADYEFAERATTGNCALVRRSKVCGCLYCGNIFMAHKAVFLPEFGDGGTVLCPHCKCDAVIPDAAGQPIDPETLDRIAHAFYHYRDDDPDKGPLVIWRGHGNLLFQNWLNYYVYQETPYDINAIR